MYTHEITYSVGDGGRYIKARIGTQDGKVVFKFIGTSQPVDKAVIEGFIKFATFGIDVYKEFSGLKEISIKPISGE